VDILLSFPLDEIDTPLDFSKNGRSVRGMIGSSEGAVKGGSNGEAHGIWVIPELVTAAALVGEE
jgi:hypothetical protein